MKLSLLFNKYIRHSFFKTHSGKQLKLYLKIHGIPNSKNNSITLLTIAATKSVQEYSFKMDYQIYINAFSLNTRRQAAKYQIKSRDAKVCLCLQFIKQYIYKHSM